MDDIPLETRFVGVLISYDISTRQYAILDSVRQNEPPVPANLVIDYLDKAYDLILPIGTLYGHIRRLVRKGYLRELRIEPLNVRGGRGKNGFELTKDAIEMFEEIYPD